MKIRLKFILDYHQIQAAANTTIELHCVSPENYLVYTIAKNENISESEFCIIHRDGTLSVILHIHQESNFADNYTCENEEQMSLPIRINVTSKTYILLCF